MARNEVVNLTLEVGANVNKAKQELKSLQDSLSNLITKNTISPVDGITADITKATQAAAELKAHLANAMNSTTGKLDFSVLNRSFKESGKSLAEYGEQLQRLGPEGQQAFMRVTEAVATSEIPMRRLGNVAGKLWTELKKVATWQLTSSVMHGFMGAMSTAYGYAKDLNESLNNIRIVTGQSVDQMAAFAEQANKAAKALSTTTTDYTNASLIYFQQGR